MKRCKCKNIQNIEYLILKILLKFKLVSISLDMYSLSILDVRFLYGKDVLAVVRAAQSEERQVFWSVLFYLILEKLLWLVEVWGFFPLHRHQNFSCQIWKLWCHEVSQSLDK